MEMSNLFYAWKGLGAPVLLSPPPCLLKIFIILILMKSILNVVIIMMTTHEGRSSPVLLDPFWPLYDEDTVSRLSMPFHTFFHFYSTLFSGENLKTVEAN